MIIDGLKIQEHSIYQFKEKSEGFIDLAKHYVFKAHFWVTLVVVFLVGIYTVDVFSIVYLGGTFVFLWFGTDFYLKPLRKIISTWNILLMCNISIIVAKVFVKVFVCNIGDIEERIAREDCWVICEYCASLNKDLSLLTDIIVFVFIIIQRRIFLSYYFYNIINETYAITVLSISIEV